MAYCAHGAAPQLFSSAFARLPPAWGPLLSKFSGPQVDMMLAAGSLDYQSRNLRTVQMGASRFSSLENVVVAGGTLCFRGSWVWGTHMADMVQGFMCFVPRVSACFLSKFWVGFVRTLHARDSYFIVEVLVASSWYLLCSSNISGTYWVR